MTHFFSSFPQREIITTRWANEDPNPTTIAAVKRSHMDAFQKAAVASWEALPEEQKRARIQQLQVDGKTMGGKLAEIKCQFRIFQIVQTHRALV